jgi:hypothetical protein
MHSPVNLLASLALFFFMALSPLGIAYPTELGNDLTPLNPIPIDGRNKVSLSNLNRRDMMISPRSQTPANLIPREPGHIDRYNEAAATFILTHNGEEHHLTGTIREVLS